MISFSLIKESLLKKGKRILKVVELGAKTAKEVSSFGDDSVPLKDMTAIYAKTRVTGEEIIIGYINKNQISQPGEKRIYSLNSDGSLSAAIHLKANGVIEINQPTDFAVKHTALTTAITAHDTAINLELAKIATAIAAIGGTYTVAPISTDISASKVEKVKLP